MLHGDRQQAQEYVSEYSNSCIDMRVDEVLISAEESALEYGYVRWWRIQRGGGSS